LKWGRESQVSGVVTTWAAMRTGRHTFPRTPRSRSRYMPICAGMSRQAAETENTRREMPCGATAGCLCRNAQMPASTGGAVMAAK